MEASVRTKDPVLSSKKPSLQVGTLKRRHQSGFALNKLYICFHVLFFLFSLYPTATVRSYQTPLLVRSPIGNMILSEHGSELKCMLSERLLVCDDHDGRVRLESAIVGKSECINVGIATT